ncbi:hypothetical protein K2X89_09085 [Myxococcota bacterium]|nr:hypothetical protein [Myxococcota bacterium]
MFRRLSEPLPLSEASLLYFRPALNAPVLNVGYLPIGPARAAVVAFGEEYGGIGIALGVRANESGQVVVLRNPESIDFDVPLAEALEPLLDEAERMGFLFDEDVFEESPGQVGRAKAMAHWAELMGGLERLIPKPSPDPDALRREDDDGPVGPLSPSQAIEEMQYPELMLDHVAPLELPDEIEDPIELEETETLEPDPDPEPLEVRTRGWQREPDFDEPLEHDLDEALEGALDDSLGGELEELDADEHASLAGPMLDDPLLGESDLTEPTAPISAPRAAAAKPASPPRKPSIAPRTATPPIVPPSTGPAAGAPHPEPMAAAPKARPTPAPPPRPIPAPPPVRTAPPEPPAPPAPVSVSQPVLPRVVLSKFRNPEGLRGAARAGGASEIGVDRSSELARIPIVRVRRERNPGKRVPFLARLLSSF